MALVYCSDYLSLARNALLERPVADRYPGSGWVAALAKLAEGPVVSWDVAEQRIRAGEWRPQDCLLLDEIGSAAAQRLVQLGCVPFLQTAYEAPLYAPRFYDSDRSSGPFRFRMRYGAKDDLARGEVAQFFPAFFAADLRPIVDWSARSDTVVCVAANKYRSAGLDASTITSKANGLRWLKHWVGLRVSPSYRQAVAISLHDYRLEFLAALAGAGRLALYGQGWDDLRNLPAAWRRRLAGLAASNRGRCADKIDAIRGHKYALCFENIAMPGYVTEKIIDCLFAGVVPIYLGAPDIDKFVPADALIDARRFENARDLCTGLDALSEARWREMVARGQAFLASPEGRRFSCEGSAETILRLAKAVG